MTNRQWVLWQMIDISDEELLGKFSGFVCDVCAKYVIRNGACPVDCDSLLLDWLKKEHKEEAYGS